MQARQKQLLKFIHLIFLTHQWTPVLKDLHKKYHLFDKKKAIWVIWYCKPIQIVHFHHWMYHIRKKKLILRNQNLEDSSVLFKQLGLHVILGCIMTPIKMQHFALLVQKHTKLELYRRQNSNQHLYKVSETGKKLVRKIVVLTSTKSLSVTKKQLIELSWHCQWVMRERCCRLSTKRKESKAEESS